MTSRDNELQTNFLTFITKLRESKSYKDHIIPLSSVLINHIGSIAYPKTQNHQVSKYRSAKLIR